MEKSIVKLWIIIAAAFCVFEEIQGTNLRLRQALISAGDWLNDADGDNIPGRAGIDYPVYSSVPEGTSFRCKNYDYAGYFADVEADCQAYHVCFPDGRNASFLCVNGTVFHQRYFVCDWWFHSNCSLAPDIYELNLYRKIPLPVLPPVKRRPFPGPAPQPEVQPQPRPRQPSTEPKSMTINPGNRKDNPNQNNKENERTQRPPNDRVPATDRKKPPGGERKPPVDGRKPPVDGRKPPVDGRKPPVDGRKPPVDGRKPPSNERKPSTDKPTYPDIRGDNCNCQCESTPAAKYAASAVQYENTIEIH